MNNRLPARLNGVDVLKFIMAFAVIIIHVKSLFDVNYQTLLNWFIRLAVPYFFIVSGFLTARRLTILGTHHERTKYLKKRALRFGKMFLSWILIYLPISLITFNYSNIEVLSKSIIMYVKLVMFYGESRFAWPLWYLYSSMIAYFILSVLSRWRWGRITALLLAALVVAVLVVFPCLSLPNQIAYYAKGLFHRVLSGFPYILTGFLLWKYNHKANNTFFILSFLAMSLTAFYFHVEIYSLLGGAALFLISYKIELSDNDLYNNLNTIGIWIYLTHMLNLLVIKVLFFWANISIDKYTLLLISFIFTFTTSFLLFRLSNKKGFMWLKKLV